MEKFRKKYSLHSPRASWWNYQRNAAYFITINTRKGLHFFGEISSEKMVLTDIGGLVEKEWVKIPEIRPDMNIKLGAFVVMPNHFHGILIIGQNEFNISTQSKDTMHSRDAMHCVSTEGRNKFGPQSKNLPSIIRGIKSAVTTAIRKTGDNAFAWQPRYYDHIIRDRADYKRIENYILNNPKNWDLDRFNDKSK